MPPTQEEMTEWMNAWYDNPPSRDELREAWREFGRPAGWTDHGNFEYIGQYPLGAFVLGDYLEFTGDAGRAMRWARVEEAMERGLILRQFDEYRYGIRHEDEEEDDEEGDEGDDGEDEDRDDKDDGRGRGSGQEKRGGRGGSRGGRGGSSAGQTKRGRGRPKGSTKGSTKA